MPFPNQYLPQKVIMILISISIDCWNLCRIHAAYCWNCAVILHICAVILHKSYKMYSSVWLLSGLHLWDLPISLHLSVFCFPLYQSHCMGKLFIHSCWLTFGLFPSFGHYEKTFYEYSCASFLVDLSRCADLLKWNCQITENINVQR